MTLRLITCYAVLWGAILMGCTTNRPNACLNQSLDLCDTMDGAHVVVYRRAGELHAVVLHDGIYHDPAFRTRRRKLDGQYLFTIENTNPWKKR